MAPFKMNFSIRSEFLYIEFDLKEILILTEGYFNLMTQILSCIPPNGLVSLSFLVDQ